MRQSLTVLLTTLLLLAVLDGIVAVTLNWAERQQRLSALVNYFEYGRSVPGKQERWELDPDVPGNLYDVAWQTQIIANSQRLYQAKGEEDGPVIRSYGMSFANRIIRSALELEPGLQWDVHAGPGGPPNFTYSLFEDDRQNRKPGDIVVLAILASSVPAMTAMTNSTWVFEQPAPFTYPIYQPEGDGLKRIEPLVQTAAQQRTLAQDEAAATAWYAQLSREDVFYDVRTFGAVWLDASPFFRLVRRSLAISHIEKTKGDVLRSERYPYPEVLRRIISEFAETARADAQVPVVLLIQTRRSAEPDLLPITLSVLEENNIPYLATAEHFDPQDHTGFVLDGHYAPDVDRLFGQEFLKLLDRIQG